MKKNTILIILVIAGIIIYRNSKKRKGSVEIGPLRSGFNLQDILSPEEKTMYEL